MGGLGFVSVFQYNPIRDQWERKGGIIKDSHLLPNDEILGDARYDFDQNDQNQLVYEYFGRHVLVSCRKGHYKLLADRSKGELCSFEYSNDSDSGQWVRSAQPAETMGKEGTVPILASSSFSLFSVQERPKLEEEFPSATLGFIAREIASRYRNLPPSQRGEYEYRAKVDLARATMQFHLHYS